MKEHDFPVYGTQGGGLAREVNGTYVFVTKPNCPGLGVGDVVPREWDLQPANAAARQECDIGIAESSFPDARSSWESWMDSMFDFN